MARILFALAAIMTCSTLNAAPAPNSNGQGNNRPTSPPNVILITEVLVDLSQDLLLVSGENFGDESALAATLANAPIGIVNGSGTDTFVMLNLPLALPDGDYRLTLISNDQGGSSGSYDLTIGAVGPEGPTGPSGPAGADGQDGAQGPVGPTGPAGADGQDGAQGPVGPTGPAGADGQDGAQGPVGPTGADGAVGPIGPPGADGADAVFPVNAVCPGRQFLYGFDASGGLLCRNLQRSAFFASRSPGDRTLHPFVTFVEMANARTDEEPGITDRFDENDDYDSLTGRFTAPVDGLYQFDASASLASLVGDEIWVFIGVNGEFGVDLDIPQNNTFFPGELGVIAAGGTIELSKGDYVSVWVGNTTVQNFAIDGGSSFSGQLEIER